MVKLIADGRLVKWTIPFSFYSLQWRHTQTQSVHLIIARVASLRWRVYPRDQSRISAGVRKSLIYAPTSLQWVTWIGYSLFLCAAIINVNKWKIFRDRTPTEIQHWLQTNARDKGSKYAIIKRILWDRWWSPPSIGIFFSTHADFFNRNTFLIMKLIISKVQVSERLYEP